MNNCCPYCFEKFSLNQAPRKLKCEHILCESCVKLLDSNPRTRYCPFDKTSFFKHEVPISQGGLLNLKSKCTQHQQPINGLCVNHYSMVCKICRIHHGECNIDNENYQSIEIRIDNKVRETKISYPRAENPLILYPTEEVAEKACWIKDFANEKLKLIETLVRRINSEIGTSTKIQLLQEYHDLYNIDLGQIIMKNEGLLDLLRNPQNARTNLPKSNPRQVRITETPTDRGIDEETH